MGSTSYSLLLVVEKEKRRKGRGKMIETLLTLGILGILVFIASKLEVINHNTDLIVELLLGKGKPPLPFPVIRSFKENDG